MDNKRFFAAIVFSALILLVSQYFLPHPPTEDQPKPSPQSKVMAEAPSAPERAAGGAPSLAVGPATGEVLPVEKRLPLNATAVHGSINLVGARLDDLALNGYRETTAPNSALVRVLEPAGKSDANYIEFGWVPAAGETVSVPDARSVWSADGPSLSEGHPLTLSWDNGAGVQFQIVFSIDKDFMFHVEQKVRNNTDKPVTLYPFSRVMRGYTPEQNAGMLVHEGPIAVMNGRLQESTYAKVKKAGVDTAAAFWNAAGKGGWTGITDKYWLSAVIPDQNSRVAVSHGYVGDKARGFYQAGFIDQSVKPIQPGGESHVESYAFSGAKEVRLLEYYEKTLHIPDFWKAVDFGWFAFLTRPIFFVLDWLNTQLGNFGLALMAFTLIVKGLFFPLASRQFRSMGKMKALQPKMQEMRKRYKDDPMELNQRMMALYREEGVNPLGGCLPLLLQIPVFWCLYKDLYVTIEMRHAPFFGWIKDLSAEDPTNIFNLFGLIPWDPTTLTPLLHIGVWAILFGATMYLQQKLNPAPMDPAQQRIFQMMPIIFTFVLARQPVGLVIYYCWNNLLTILQQHLIQNFLPKRAERKSARGHKG